MYTANIIYHIARADFLERTRRYSFLITIALTMLAAYMFVPPMDANYATFYLGDYRGIYNSAWVGGIVAISTTMFLSFFGFFLVKNSIERDVQTRVGYIIAGTSLKKTHYLLGKALSNFAILTVIAIMTMIVAIMMQLIRGEDRSIDLWAIASPFLIIVIPQMAIVAALAIVFESWQALRGVTGNIIYLVLFVAYISTTMFGNISTNFISGQMRSDLQRITPGYDGTYGQGILFLDNPLQTFKWDGIQWSGSIVIRQLLFFVIALVLCLFAAMLFRGFADMSIVKKQTVQGKGKRKIPDTERETDKIPFEEASILGEELVPKAPEKFISSQLTPVKVRFHFWPLVRAELCLMLKGLPWIWYAIAAVLGILCLLLPNAASVRYFWPIAWIWPLIVWSNMGSREMTYRTHALIVTSPKFIARQIPAIWVVGYIVTAITGSGMLIRFLVEGDLLHIVYWMIGSLFIPTFALGLGVLTHSKKTFEVLYMILWYVGPINKVPVLDFLGAGLEANSLGNAGLDIWLTIFGYIVLSIVLFIMAFIGRSKLADMR